MTSQDKTPKHIRLNERNHVELPLLEQLDGLGWNIVDLTREPTALAAGQSLGDGMPEMPDASAFGSQNPSDTGRETFTEVILPQVLRQQLIVINPWLEEDQIEEVIKQLTANWPGSGLIENNKHLLHLLLENTSVSENRQTGEQSPTVRFVDFKSAENNDFTAVCQFKVRILGTEHHIIPDIVLFLNGLPVVVIECKSPKVKDAIPEAIDQMMRYSEQRIHEGGRAKGEGSQPLFFYNQFVIATCRNECKFGTISTHSEKYFYRWDDPSRTTAQGKQPEGTAEHRHG